jgi:hypothetical protein
VALVAGAAGALRLAHPALVVGEECDLGANDLLHPRHIPRPAGGLAAAMHVDDRRQRAGVLREEERSGEDGANAAETNPHLRVVSQDDLRAEGDMGELQRADSGSLTELPHPVSPTTTTASTAGRSRDPALTPAKIGPLLDRMSIALLKVADKRAPR